MPDSRRAIAADQGALQEVDGRSDVNEDDGGSYAPAVARRSALLPRIVGAAFSFRAWNARPDGAMSGCGRPERRRPRPLGRHASRGTPGRERR